MRTTIGLLVALVISALGCHREAPTQHVTDNASFHSLENLPVPASVLVRAGVGAAELGDFDQALSLLSRAAERLRDGSPAELNDSLERVVIMAIERDDAAAAQSGYELLCTTTDRNDRDCQALRLRVDDLSRTTHVERQAIDREIRQLRHNRARGGPTAVAIDSTAECDHLEALYWRRYRLAESAAHRIDALNGVTDVCGRPEAVEQMISALRDDADEALGAGQNADAVTYLEVVVQHARSGSAVSQPEAAEAQEMIHHLLWPTYLANRRSRFERRFAEIWAENHWFDAEQEQIAIVIEALVPPECSPEQVTTCDSLLATVRNEALAELARLACDAAELAAGQVDPRLHLEPIEVSLVRLEGQSAYFRAAVSLETLIRAVYDANSQLAPPESGQTDTRQQE